MQKNSCKHYLWGSHLITPDCKGKIENAPAIKPTYQIKRAVRLTNIDGQTLMVLYLEIFEREWTCSDKEHTYIGNQEYIVEPYTPLHCSWCRRHNQNSWCSPQHLRTRAWPPGTSAPARRTSASRPRSLASVADRFLASAQALPAGGNSGIIHFYYWDKPQVAVKSFPAERIRALIADQEGSYLIGGGSNGNMFLWGFSLKLVSIFDMFTQVYFHRCLVKSFSTHGMRTIVLLGASRCMTSLRIRGWEYPSLGSHHIWSLSEGRMLRSISFPTSIGSIALDPRSHIFYAGGRDGKIYVTAMGVDLSFHVSDESSILGTLDDHSKAVTSLASSKDGLLLVSGSEDGNVQVWDTRCQQVTRKFKHSQGPVTNVLIVTPKRVNLPPLQPLHKVCSANGEAERGAVILPRPENDVPIPGNKTSIFMEHYLDELQVG
ncbi:unnamed protein product [Miscanthus lutarioriparius]|uniref:Uncharacterized protein n=1 Tax=Miscanthus lutarioriparius TaxID=422564 RepID=A0A811PN13_9POAL|nr:unnamed protein product [Miscanthus lutarioriparius]